MSPGLEIAAKDWQTLSPLVDEGLAMPVTEREAWAETRPGLSEEQRLQLRRLLAEPSAAPESASVFRPIRDWVAARAHEPTTPFARDHIVGPYQLLRLIGRGGMAEVWLARRIDGAYEREVALKLPRLDRSADAVLRLQRESNILASLEHSGIARLYDAGVTSIGQPYLAMEYIEGESLLDYANGKALNLSARAELIAQILQALQYAHQRLVVHRDLKPGNIRVRPDGRVVLLDFGISKLLTAELVEDPAQTNLTQQFGTALTLGYAAPEQLAGDPLSVGVDLFTVGAMWFELCTGRRPYAEHEKSLATLLTAMAAPPAAVNLAHRPDDTAQSSEDPQTAARAHGYPLVETWQRAFVGDPLYIARKALRRLPADRYTSAEAMHADIRAYIEARPISVRRDDRVYRLARFWERNKRVLAVSVLTSALVSVLITQVASQYNAAQKSATAASQTRQMLRNMVDSLGPEQGQVKKQLIDNAMKALAAGADPNPLRTQVWFAEVYMEADACEDAVRLSESVEREARTRRDVALEADALAVFGDCYAGSIAQRAKVESKYTDFMTRHGASLESQGQLDETSYAKSLLRLGMLAFVKGDNSTAQKILEFAAPKLGAADTSRVRLDQLAYVQHLLGLIATAREDFVKAEALLKGGLAALGDSPAMLRRNAIRGDLVRVWASLGFNQEALAEYDKLIAGLSPMVPVHSEYMARLRLGRVLALMRVGRLEEAERETAAVGNLVVTYPQLKNLQNEIDMREIFSAQYRGDDVTAEKRLRAMAAQSGDKTNPLIRRFWAVSLLKLDEDDAAIEQLQNVLAGRGVSFRPGKLELATGRGLLGLGYLRQGDDTRALSELRAARADLLSIAGEHHPRLHIVEAYLALVPGSELSSDANRFEVAKALRRSAHWQAGTPSVIEALEIGLSAERRSALSVLH